MGFFKKLMLVLAIVLITVLVTRVVSSVPPVTTIQDFTEGYSLVVSKQQYISLGDNYTLNFFVYNISNGMIIDNASTTCKFYLDDGKGDLVYNNVVSYLPQGYWSISITGTNFSEKALYDYGIACNSSVLGGTTVGAWQVTNTGDEFTIEKAVYSTSLMFLLIFLFIFTLVISTKFPEGNDTDDYGLLLGINNLKYVRPVCYMVAWGLMLAIFFTTSNVALAYFQSDMFGNLFFAFYSVMMWLSYPLVLLYAIYILLQIFRDKEMKAMMDRGVQAGDI